MAGKIGFSVRNTRGLIANLRQYEAASVARAKMVSENSMERVYATQQSLVAVDTGFMKNATRKELSPSGLAYRVGWNAQDFPGYPYFFVVEFGGRFQTAQPSLLPAFEMEKPRYLAEMREAIRPRGRATSAAS